MAEKSDRETLKLGVVTPYLAASVITYLCGIWTGHWAAQIAAMIGFIVLPGYTALSFFRVRFENWVVRTAVAIGLGMATMMVVGVAASWLGPVVGIERPLDSNVQLVIYGFILVVGVLWERMSNQLTMGFEAGGKLGRVVLAGALPIGAVLGAERLNRGNGAELAVVVVVSAWLVLLGIVAVSKLPTKNLGELLEAAMFGSGLSIVLGTAMRGQWLFGWDIQREYAVAESTSRAGVWSADGLGGAYNSMLSITSMPAQLHSLTGVSLEIVFRLFYVVLLAGVPVVLFSLLRNLYSMRASALGVIVLIISARAYPQQLPSIARQDAALFIFIAALAVLIAGVSTSTRGRQLLFTLLAGSVGFTHYTTGYTVVVLLLGSLAYTLLSGGRKRGEGGGVLTVPVVAGVLAMILSWNFLIAPSRESIGQPLETVAELEVGDQGRNGEGFVKRWLTGTEVRSGTVEQYAAQIEAARAGKLDWLVPDTALAGGVVQNAKSVTYEGVLSTWYDGWWLVVVVARQLTVLAAAAAVAVMLWRRKRAGVLEPLVGMIIVAFALNAIMRTSTWAATYYNPERSEMHNAMLLSFAVVYLLDLVYARGRRDTKPEKKGGKNIGTRLVRLVPVGVIALASVVSFENLGLGSLLFKGAPRAAVAEVGESVERFTISDAERRGALWMQANIPGGVIQTDRYGKMIVDGNLDSKAGVVDIMHPDYIDQNAWVFATRTNIVEGRARGYMNKVFSVYEAPVDRLDKERAILYANDKVRVYK